MPRSLSLCPSQNSTLGSSVQLLLDTHAFLWWLNGDLSLPKRLRELIANDRNEIYVSAASAWEISTKVRLGKLPGAVAVAENFALLVLEQGFSGLQISLEHASYAGALPGPHRDPFDRMLVAQAVIENLELVSNEIVFDNYGVQRLW